MFQLNKKYVGQMIQEVREQRGLQQKDLASKIGVSQSTMSKIEAGGWKKADIETFVNISKTLNVRLEYLLGIDKDIDDDTHLVNLFMKKSFRIITTQKFIKNANQGLKTQNFTASLSELTIKSGKHCLL